MFLNFFSGIFCEDSTHAPKVKLAGIRPGCIAMPLAIEMEKKYNMVAFDINPLRVARLCYGIDITYEANL